MTISVDSLQPNMTKGDEPVEKRHRSLLAGERRLGLGAAALHVPVIDLVAPFRRSDGAQLSELFLDAIHFTPKGNRLLVQIVADAITAEQQAVSDGLSSR
ncbi:MAG: hypothetical protein RX316_06115 [bacterium]|nr:hypothetical protein [bacterium]